jgi:plastocyanin
LKEILMKRLRTIVLAAIALLVGVFAVNTVHGVAGTRVLAAPSARPSAATKQVRVTTTASGQFAFSPKTLKIKVGTKVKWINQTQAPHTVTGTGSWKFSSATFNAGGTLSRVFKKAGTFHYKCAIHPYMTATIVVTN